MKTAIIVTSIIVLVCAGFLTGYFLNSQLNTASDLPENLVITNVDLGVANSGVWIAITVNNTGISTVNVVKLLFNNVKQSSVSPSLPITLAADAGAIINATIDATESEYQTDALNIDVITSKGNTFSKIFEPSLTIKFQGSSSLTITNIRFETGNQYTTISAKNTGTKTVTIAAIKVNNVAVTINGTSTLTYDAGDSGTIGIDLAWTSGNPYKFDLYDSSGQVVGSYQATAPG
jgi:hypothetical protein